jgi:hypothetical protein
VGLPFLTSAIASFLATVAIVTGAGYLLLNIHIPIPGPPREVFHAGSFEFDLAPGWWCELDGSEYVCNPPGKPPFSAIAIIAIKERKTDDNLQAYEEHLRQPQRVDNGAGKSTMSVVSYVRRVKLGHTEWVEALHVGSEVPNYNTYYLATNTSHLAILVTMSVYKDHEDVYLRQLTEMISTFNLYER